MSVEFLHFWAEYLRQVADGQQRIEAMGRWIRSGCPPKDALGELLRTCYGLPPAAPLGGDLWQKAMADFRTGLDAYAPFWGWVPLARYDRLKNKTKHLESKIADQERTIKQLEALLVEKGLGHTALMTRFQNLITDQSQAFDELIQTITDVSDGSNHHS